jgi:hypothetical protein
MPTAMLACKEDVYYRDFIARITEWYFAKNLQEMQQHFSKILG